MLTSPVVFFRGFSPAVVHVVVPFVVMSGLSSAYSFVLVFRTICDVPAWVLVFIGVSDAVFYLVLLAFLSCAALLAARLAGAREYSKWRLVKCLVVTFWLNVPILVVSVGSVLLYEGAWGDCVDVSGFSDLDAVVESWENPRMFPAFWPAVTALFSYFWLMTIGWQSAALYAVSRCSVRAALMHGLVLGGGISIWWLLGLVPVE